MPEFYFPPLPPGDGLPPTIDQLLQFVQQRVNTFYRAISFTGGTITVVGANGAELEISDGELLFRSGHASETTPGTVESGVVGDFGYLHIIAPEIDDLSAGFPSVALRAHATDSAQNLVQIATNNSGFSGFSILTMSQGLATFSVDTAVVVNVASNEVARFTADGLTEAATGVVHNDFTPTLEAETTDPTLGTGSDTDGQYSISGGWCHGWVRWRFGTSGVNAGSGVYEFTPPVAAHASVVGSNTSGEGTVVGHGWVRDNSAATNSIGVTLQARDATTFWFIPNDDNTFLSNSTPWTWAASDRITIHFSYPIA